MMDAGKAMQGMTIRRAAAGDFGQLVALFREFSEFEHKERFMTNSEERMLREQDFFNALVVVDGKERIVAYAAYFFCYFTWSGKALYMDDLYVRPEYRGSGIGRELVRRLIDMAKTEGCHKLRWQVAEWNAPAIEFYKKLGAEIDTVNQNCDLVF